MKTCIAMCLMLCKQYLHFHFGSLPVQAVGCHMRADESEGGRSEERLRSLVC